MGRAIQVEFLLAGITDSSGEPLASGKVYTYEAGTTSDKTTHTDQAQSIEATNPVILGTRGEASIFAEGAYKFVIKDSSDVPVVTIDGLQYVYPDNTNIYAGSSTGSANAYVLSPSPASQNYVDGTTYTFIANFASTGAATINVSGLGAKSFVLNDGSTALGVGDILVSMLVNAQYIGASDHFRLVSAAGVLAVSGGGTGADNATDARTNLGLGSMAVQAAGAVAISGGTVVGITDLTVLDGGTGASTAADARTNLGLGSMAVQAAGSVAISGGTIAGATISTSTFSGTVAISGGTVSGITDLAVADGGTGSSTAPNARAALSAAVLGANNDITSLAVCTTLTSSAQVDIVATGANAITFWTGGDDKVAVPAGITTGSAGVIPLINDWYTLGSASFCWQTLYTVGVLGKSGGPLTLASVAGQDISMKAGNSTVWWTFTSAGKLQWNAAPDYTATTHTTRRSLDPAVATAQQCADAWNTLITDLITAGILT
jgi:hypothetical protein